MKNQVINQEKIYVGYHVVYDSSLSKTSSLLFKTQGNVFSDKFQFEDNSILISEFPYLLGNQQIGLNSSFFGGGYSLPFKFNNTNQSLIHQLFKKNHITYLSYAFILNNKDFGKRKVFGSISDDRKWGKCKVILNQS